MNTTTLYEQLIAVKLNQVTVPDMADDIWTGIEEQLDAVDKAAAKKPLPGHAGKGWLIIVCVVAAVVLVLVLWQHNNHKNNTPVIVPPTKTLPVSNDSLGVADSTQPVNNSKKKSPTAVPSIKQAAPVTPAKDSLLLNASLPGYDTSPDSLAKQTSPPAKMDSALQNSLIAAPLFNPAIIKRHDKKPKGVKGITSEDYKISVKKDSTKNEN